MTDPPQGWSQRLNQFIRQAVPQSAQKPNARLHGAERLIEMNDQRLARWLFGLCDLSASPAYERALHIARQLLGDDMAFDFDMLIDKAPGTETPTPFHQDMAYWVHLPDRRALSCWIALDEATTDNGCMWFAPGTHRSALRKHRSHGTSGGALECDGTEAECVCVPLQPGSCTFHDGGVMHYSRGNSTAGHRRALIINFRPAAMIRLERERGFDHGKTQNVRENKNVLTQG
jgi:phytanoyl-CoA hydroxylase